MTFDQLPTETRTRLYSVTGGLVRELTTDSNGRISSDGRGDTGELVGIGVYYLMAERDGVKKITKVGVRR